VRLLLARHGQSLWNQVRKFQGANDVGLSDLGRVQSAALGRALRTGYRVAAAYVSPMCRALDTAEIALAGTGIPLVPIPELRELSLGEWEGCTVDEVRAREGNPYHAWVRSPLDCPPPGGEPLPDVCGRVLKAIGQIGARHRNGDDVLVVAHGGVISVYLCHLLGVSFNSLWRMRIDNCSLTIARPPRLVSVNDTAHLPSTPNTAIPPSTLMKTSKPFSDERPPKINGRKILSIVEPTPPQIPINITARPACPVDNNQIAAGIHTGQAPTTGRSERNAISTPQNTAEPKPTIANAPPQINPWTAAITRLVVTLAKIKSRASASILSRMSSSNGKNSRKRPRSASASRKK